MHTNVVERSAARERFLTEPGAKLGDAGAPKPKCLGVVDVTRARLARTELSDALRIGPKALIHAHRQDPTGALCGFDDDGLLRWRWSRMAFSTITCLPAASAPSASGAWKHVRRCDEHRIDFRIGQQALRWCRRCASPPRLPASSANRSGCGIAGSDHARVRVPVELLASDATDLARAQHTKAKVSRDICAFLSRRRSAPAAKVFFAAAVWEQRT